VSRFLVRETTTADRAAARALPRERWVGERVAVHDDEIVLAKRLWPASQEKTG